MDKETGGTQYLRIVNQEISEPCPSAHEKTPNCLQLEYFFRKASTPFAFSGCTPNDSPTEADDVSTIACVW